MDHNLSAPFTLSEVVVEVKPTPKARKEDPRSKDHLLCFKEEHLGNH